MTQPHVLGNCVPEHLKCNPCGTKIFKAAASDLWKNSKVQSYRKGGLRTAELRDATGKRGERLFELSITNYAPKVQLFRPGFLGDKWPAADFYVELLRVKKRTPYFLAQVKSTAVHLPARSRNLAVSTKKRDIQRLLQYPGPTYLFGVHEPSKRVFVRSVHRSVGGQATTRIPLRYELTTANLQALHDEVRQF